MCSEQSTFFRQSEHWPHGPLEIQVPHPAHVLHLTALNFTWRCLEEFGSFSHPFFTQGTQYFRFDSRHFL